VRSDLPFEAFDFQIGNLSGQSGVCALGYVGSVLIPADCRHEIFLLLVQRPRRRASLRISCKSEIA